jgi:hypothetical protein
MATNLRLRPAAEEAVRSRAARTGRSQQELIREAVDRYLGLGEVDAPRSESEAMLATQGVLPARMSYRELHEMLRLREGTTTGDLLVRDERF